MYGGMVEAMDLAVGKVLDGLKEHGLENNTVVFFMSDNGGLSTSEGHPTSNLPLRGGKGWMYEGGIREPMMVRWPGVTKPGSVNDTPVTSTDFFPTIMEMAGLKPQLPLPIDGVSFTTALRGKPQDRGAIYWHYPHYGNQGNAPTAAVREGDWKLIGNTRNPSVTLHNLADAKPEVKDHAKEKPGVVARLRALQDAWAKEVSQK